MHVSLHLRQAVPTKFLYNSVRNNESRHRFRTTLATATLLGVCLSTFAQDLPSTDSEIDPQEMAEATANWFRDQITVQDGSLHLAGVPLSKIRNARFSFPQGARVKLVGNYVVIEGTDLFPIEFNAAPNGFVFSIYTPFYDFLDDQLASDGLPGYTRHPKDDALNVQAFRTMIESIHEHLVEVTGSEPQGKRRLGQLGYPKELYEWNLEADQVTISIYQGNDTKGFFLNFLERPTKPAPTEAVGLEGPTNEEPFQGWGPMLPHQKGSKSKSE